MCYRTLDGSDTWLYQINALTGGALDSNSTYIKQLGNQGVAGKRTKGTIDQPVKLVEANKSPAVSKDGESLSGNDIDAELDAELSKAENFDLPIEHYLTEDSKAILSNGLDIVTPDLPLQPQKPLKPQRISIRKIF